MVDLERLKVIPVVHGRIEPAKRVRRELEAFQAQAIAVEVPETLAAPWLRAVERLPLLSILRWQEQSGRAAHLLVEPADGTVEAARWGRERGVPVVCADRDTEAYGGHHDLVPDTWLLERVTPERYDEMCLAGSEQRDDPEDERREATMAFHLRRLLDGGARVALVCGAAHAVRVVAALEGAAVRPLGRTRRDGVELYHLHVDASREVLSEPAWLQAAYERWRAGAPRTDPFVDESTAIVEPAAEEASRRDRIRSRALFAARSKAAVTATPPVSSSPPSPPSPPSLPSIAVATRKISDEKEPDPERYQLASRLARAARDRSRTEDGDNISSTALAVLARMSRNWARLAGRFSPDLVQLVTCARGVGGEDFAYRYWELATSYPYQTTTPGLPVLRPTVEELYESSARLRFRRSMRTRHHRLRVVQPRPKEARPGEWKEEWKGDSIVSYPPEDIVLEGYGAFLRKRAVGILSAEQSRSEPLTSSLLDGVDLRETIRNLAHDGRIFVREDRPVRGEVGAVVVIFNEDPDETRFPWKMTWQGEHEEESDMALYATTPGEKLVGPGVARCEYGGFVMTLPPGRMFHVWQDPFFEIARTKSERLLLAGIDYSLERLVVYVAAKPPRSALSGHASRHNKKVVYVPIGQLSPIMLAKIRVFHVLDGRRVRAYAKTFIRS